MSEFLTFVIRGVVPNHMDCLFSRVSCLDFLQKRDGAAAVYFENLDKGRIEISRHKAPWIFTRFLPLVVLTAVFEPFLIHL